MVAGVEELRIELHRLAEAGDGLVRAALLAAHEAEAVVDLRACGAHGQRRLVVARGAVEVLLLLAQPAEHVAGVHGGGIQGERALESRPRLGHAVLSQERDPFRDAASAGEARRRSGGGPGPRPVAPARRPHATPARTRVYRGVTTPS